MATLHPRVGVENLEGYLSCRGTPWGTSGLNLTLSSPVQRTGTRKMGPHNFWLWRSVRISPRWDGRLLETQVLKGQHSKSCSQALNQGSSRGTVALRGQESYRERLSCVALGRGLEGQTPMSPLLSPSPTPPTETIFPGSSTPLCTSA